MTVQEAKEWLNELKDSEEILEFYYADNIKEALDIAIESMEKQIPKKVERWADRQPCCPICKRGVVKPHRYCVYCGQKIDWSKEE